MEDMEFIGESLTEVQDQIRDGMTEEESKLFKTLKTDEQRIEFLLQKNETQELLKLTKVSITKNDATAKEFRLAGNSFFQKRRYVQALEQYNLAVANASFIKTDEPSELVLALGNRSAVLAHRQLFEASLENAALAIEMGYPEKNRHKLYERQGSCLLYLKRADEARSYFDKAKKNIKKSELDENKKDSLVTNIEKLLEECKRLENEKPAQNDDVDLSSLTKIESSNENYPKMSSKLDVLCDEDNGRHVKSNEIVKIGEPLIVDDPYASALYPNYWNNHCYHCLRTAVAPYPCRTTTSFVFCGRECESEAWNTYLPFEKYLTDVFQRKWCGTIGHLVLRIVFLSGAEILCGDEKDVMIKKLKETDYGKKLALFLDEKKTYKTDFSTIYCLESECDSRAEMGLFDLAVAAIYLMKCLEMIDFIPTERENKAYAASGIMHLLEVVQCNGFCIPEVRFPTDFENPGTVEIGIGLYPKAALLNHSCDPCADWTCFDGNRLVIRAARTIFKKQQITVAYRDHVFYNSGKAIRQAQLKFQYGFSCRCEACTKEWGKYATLNSTLPQYRCVHCYCEMYLGMIVDGTSAKCEKCNKSQDLKVRVKELGDGHEKYAEAMGRALGGGSNAAIPVLEEHLDRLQRFLCPPWRESTTCQAALQQCYRLQGNKRIVH